MYANTTGYVRYNVAIGNEAMQMYNNTSQTVQYCVAIGASALAANQASYNTAVGYQAGYSGTSGGQNVYLGFNTGYTNQTGSNNVYVGAETGKFSTGSSNIFIGYNSGYNMLTGSYNVIIGGYAGSSPFDITTLSNNIVLSDGQGNVRLSYTNADASWRSIEMYNNTSGSGANMVVLSSGTIARSTSALKYKQDIRDLEEMDIGLLRPVRYKSKCAVDDQTKDHFGIIADEAAESGFEELVTRGADGEVEGFQYERLTVVLLKAIQELKAEVDSLKQQLASK
jgi:hypothetical protein